MRRVSEFLEWHIDIQKKKKENFNLQNSYQLTDVNVFISSRFVYAIKFSLLYTINENSVCGY